MYVSNGLVFLIQNSVHHWFTTIIFCFCSAWCSKRKACVHAIGSEAYGCKTINCFISLFQLHILFLEVVILIYSLNKQALSLNKYQTFLSTDILQRKWHHGHTNIALCNDKGSRFAFE